MKKILITTAAIAVIATSFTTYAVSNSSTPVILNQPSQIETVVEEKDPAAGDKENVGIIEYTKTSFEFKESGETIVTEFWLDPVTLEGKTHEIVTSVDNSIEKNFTAYTKDGAKNYINILRDQNGKAVGGRKFCYSDERAQENAENLKKYDVFSGRQAMYQDMTFWKDKGTITTEGKTLKKLLCGDEKNGNITIVYVDESTGFPVKEEAFVNGKPFSTMNYEFKYVDKDDKLFDASMEEGIDLNSLDMENICEKVQALKK